MMLEVVGAALLVAGSALVLWIVVTADAPARAAERHAARQADVPILKRAA
jgi:hypothetical protein